MLKPRFFSLVKGCVLDNAAYMKYRIGSTYYDAQITNATLLDDGRITIDSELTVPQTGSVTVNLVQLYDHSGQLLAEKTENIVLKGVQEGILYRFVFTIIEA